MLKGCSIFFSVFILSTNAWCQKKSGVTLENEDNLSWEEITATMKKADKTYSYNQLLEKFGHPYDKYPTPSLVEETIAYFPIKDDTDSTFWVMFETKTMRYLYWSQIKYSKDKSGIRGGSTKNSIGKKVKQVTATSISADQKDTGIVFIHKFDEQGRLKEESQPQYYCGISYTYDNKNRITSRDVMCGESSGNGLYTTTYLPDGSIEKFSGGAYNDETRVYLNKKNARIKTIWVRKRLGEKSETCDRDSSFIKHTMVYDAKNRLIQQTDETTGGYWSIPDKKCVFTPWAPNVITTQYSYNEFDSLFTRIETNESGEINNRQVNKYDPITHLKTDNYILTTDILSAYTQPSLQNLPDIYIHTSYTYDSAGKLYRTKTSRFCTITSKEETTESESSYKNGLIDQTTNYDKCTGKIIEKISYTYEFW
jgi:hypothetical protein